MLRGGNRRGLLLAIVLVAATCAVWIFPVSPAVAQSDQECWEWVRVVTGQDEDGNPMYGWELRNVCETPGGGGSGGGPATCSWDGNEIPCYDPVRGWWSNSLSCYVTLADPQPPAGDPAWQGNDPADGAVYLVYCPVPAGGWRTDLEFLSEAPGLPSIADIARQAMESLPLAPASIGIAPDPDGVGLVGVPVWLWTEDTDATWGPVSVSVPGPGITVTAEGNAEQIEWNMGDGTTVVCDTPGTPYDPSYGGQESPDCGHIYTYPSQSQPDGRYPVTATTTWYVEWWVEPEGSGAGGDDVFIRESSTSVEIHELQVVTS